MIEEGTLLTRLVQYDLTALAQVYDEYHDKIYRYAYWHLGQVDAAEDLTANVFLRLLNAVRDGRSPHKNLSGWLYRVAHNLIVDARRTQPQEDLELAEYLEGRGPDLTQLVEQHVEMEHMRTALQQLTETQQQVIVLRFLEGMTSRQVATIMGSTEGAVDALQHRALLALRKVLQQGQRPEGEGAAAVGTEALG